MSKEYLKMNNILLLIALLPHLLCALVHGQRSFEYFTYMTKPRITDMLGQIEVRPPSTNDTFVLKGALNTITEWPSQVAGLKLARSIQESLGNVHQGPYDHLNYESELNNVCGTTSYYTDETNRLISDGETTLPGQWPWFVAIYIQRTDNENEYYFYKGAGSLLSARHVITESYSIKEWIDKKSTLVEPKRLHVSFGQLNSPEWHENQTSIINRAIVDYKLYQYRDYNRNVKTNALVILILKTAVEFNAFIKPVCLWSGTTDLQDIVNMTGYIVGWGSDVTRDESEPLSPSSSLTTYWKEPRMAKVPLMNLFLNSSDENELIQHNTTVQKGHGIFYYPTYTDNGGGLVVFNTTTGRYQLRGVNYFCDHLDIKCYIDVAKQISWVRLQLSNT